MNGTTDETSGFAWAPRQPEVTGGMAAHKTLRDAFALAIISNPVTLWALDNSSVEAVAAQAYKLADAMVAESVKP